LGELEKTSQCESHKGFIFKKKSYKVAIFLRKKLKLPYLDTVHMIEVKLALINSKEA